LEVGQDEQADRDPRPPLFGGAARPRRAGSGSGADPAIAPDLKAAMDKADAGDTKDLMKLADEGRADAQYFAGGALIYGRPGIAQDPRRGCALVEKASVSRPDAEHLLGECYQHGLGGVTDPSKAKAAFVLAAGKGFVRSRCALGEMMLAEPDHAQRGAELCQAGALAGDVAAQATLGEAYRQGTGVGRDPKEARRWFEMAAANKHPEASRKLGEMYAKGEGGKKDKKKALELWQAAEKAGDDLASILVADQLFSDITGGKQPGPGKFAFRGGIPIGDIETDIEWYKDAQKRDPRPEVKQRAEMALHVLNSFRAAAQGKPGG
jgi:TPR repeat protein